jgi:hypothetical protein
VDADAGGDRQRGRPQHPLPHRAGQVAAADPQDVGVDDGDDEGHLEALAEHDEQRGKHS